MRVLMIGFDQTMLAEGPAKPSDTKERHIKYANALRQRYPTGQIVILLRVPTLQSSRPVEIMEGLTVYPIPCPRWAFVIRLITTLKDFWQKQHFDLVTTQTPFDDGFLGSWLKRTFDIPLNVQMRSSFLDVSNWVDERPIVYRAFNLLGKWVAHQADTIRVVSQGEKLRLEEKFPRLRGKVITLHPLVNLQFFYKPLGEGERELFQAELQQHGLWGRPFLLFVGRLVIEKNLPILLRSFARVCQRMPEASLVIAGDGPLRRSLERLAKQLRLDDSILWLGNLPLPELRGWYAAARATVLSSLHEGFGKVVVESYLMGTPVIATPFVSAAELICDGRTGFIGPDYTNQEWLADRMISLLTHPEQSREMGERGRMRIQQYLLDDELYMKRLIEIWEQTASNCQSY